MTSDACTETAHPRTGLVLDETFAEHDTGPGHPERPARLQAIAGALASHGLLKRVSRIRGYTPASRDVLRWCHSDAYLDRLEDACIGNARFIDTPDSRVCRDSAEVARLAVGALLHTADAVMHGEVVNAFAAVRPPGHHAERHASMGFCLYANVALLAEHLLHEHGLERIAVVDFDVHHGNGTQHLFEQRRDVLFISLHEDPAVQYPHTGFADETGIGHGKGYTLNLPQPPGTGDEAYLRCVRDRVLPRLLEYQPQFVLVSAGFDGHTDDPLGHLELTSDTFEHMTRALTDVARQCCAGRLISVLEGGYDLQALGESVVQHVEALVEAATPTP